MGTVTISGTVYEIYGTRAAADDYLKAFMAGDPWFAASGGNRDKLLVSSGRLLDRQPWVGEKTSDVQPLAWPRTGIDGFDDATTPPAVINASFELALILLEDPAVYSQANSGSNNKFLKAGTVEIEFFRPTLGSPLPAAVNQLVKDFFGGGVTAGLASGCDKESATGKPYDLLEGYP